MENHNALGRTRRTIQQSPRQYVQVPGVSLPDFAFPMCDDERLKRPHDPAIRLHVRRKPDSFALAGAARVIAKNNISQTRAGFPPDRLGGNYHHRRPKG